MRRKDEKQPNKSSKNVQAEGQAKEAVSGKRRGRPRKKPTEDEEANEGDSAARTRKTARKKEPLGLKLPFGKTKVTEVMSTNKAEAKSSKKSDKSPAKSILKSSKKSSHIQSEVRQFRSHIQSEVRQVRSHIQG